MDVLKLIMLNNGGNVHTKFQPSILNRSQENHVSPNSCLTDGEHLNYKVASLIKNLQLHMHDG